jgi:L-asparaginase
MALLPAIKGLVVKAYGAGNFPVQRASGRSLLPVFREARKREIPIVVVSQAPRNGVDLTLYESGAAALAEGAISGGDMTPCAAVVKLMHALANCRGPNEVRRYLEHPIAGERT